MSAYNQSEIMKLTTETFNSVDPNILVHLFKKLCEGNLVFCSSQNLLEKEKAKLYELLTLDNTKVDSVVYVFQYIIHQAAFHLMKPENLAKYLVEMGLKEQLSHSLSEIWSLNAKSVIDSLKKESCSSTIKLENVESSVHYILSAHSSRHTRIPIALLHLNVATGNPFEKSTMSLEFTHEELKQFYDLLETIQNHLDQLS